MRKHIFNEDFFENIDSEKKAYWLGFICADGYINKKGNTVGITLDKSDENHLFKFLEDLNSVNGKIYHRFGKFNKDCKETEKAVLDLYSTKMNTDLQKLGISISKSTTLDKIKVPEKLMNHFIRGYFDGDGCVFEYWIKYGKLKEKLSFSPGFTFVGTENFLNFIQDYLPHKVKLKFDKRADNSYTLYFRSMKRFMEIRDYLYENASVYLDRKKEKCDKISNLIEKSSTTIPQWSTLK